jgi:hypothetical protein
MRFVDKAIDLVPKQHNELFLVSVKDFDDAVDEALA